jgi:hypothetical protein
MTIHGIVTRVQAGHLITQRAHQVSVKVWLWNQWPDTCALAMLHNATQDVFARKPTCSMDSTVWEFSVDRCCFKGFFQTCIADRQNILVQACAPDQSGLLLACTLSDLTGNGEVLMILHAETLKACQKLYSNSVEHRYAAHIDDLK